MPWLTPTAEAGDTITRLLLIPNNERFIAAVSGALVELTRAYNWEQLEVGAMTPENAANRAQDMLDAYWQNWINPLIGSLQAYMTLDAVPSNARLMDGTQYNFSDYPAMIGKVPSNWITPPNLFTLPNLNEMFLSGADPEGIENNPGDTGGSNNISLSIANLPSHTHPADRGWTWGASYISGTSAVVLGGNLGNNAAQNNAATGGNVPHENRPPFLRVLWAMIVE